MIITLSAGQVLAIHDLLNKIYLDHFGKPLDLYSSAQFSHDLYYWFQDQDVSIGKTNLIEFRKLFIILEEHRWQEFEVHLKRRKSLNSLNTICEASGQRSWTYYWKKVKAEYTDIWQELLGEDANLYPTSSSLSEDQNVEVARKCNAALADALEGNWNQASLHLRDALTTINRFYQKDAKLL